MPLYFVIYADRPIFKLGVTKQDLYKRLRSVDDLEVFNLSQSMLLRLEDERIARRLESTLKEELEPWRVPILAGERGVGDTERFYTSAYPHLISYLLKHQEEYKGKLGPLPPHPLCETREKDSGIWRRS